MELPPTSVINSVGAGPVVSASWIITAAAVVIVIAGGFCGVQKRH